MSKLPKIDQAEEKPEIPIIARFKGPGPAAYTLQTTISNEHYNGKTAPSYSFGMKLKPNKKMITPGPNEFTPKSLRNGVARAPAYSIAGRNFLQIKNTDSPGPASYSYSNYYQSKCKSSPAYSLLGRHNNTKIDTTPSPAAYSTNRKVGSDTPAWTMRPSLPKKTIQRSPGPAEYNVVNCNLTKKSPPAYSLHSRLTSNDNVSLPKGKLENNENVVSSGRRPRSKFIVPGPGAYDITLASTKRSAPKFSFGTKHSEFKAAYVEKESDYVDEE